MDFYRRWFKSTRAEEGCEDVQVPVQIYQYHSTITPWYRPCLFFTDHRRYNSSNYKNAEQETDHWWLIFSRFMAFPIYDLTFTIRIQTLLKAICSLLNGHRQIAALNRIIYISQKTVFGDTKRPLHLYLIPLKHVQTWSIVY